MTETEKRERREAAFRRANKKGARPAPVFNSTKPVVADGVVYTGTGELRHCQLLVTVKTGSNNMLARFHHWADVNRIGRAPVGRDEGRATYATGLHGRADAGDMAGVPVIVQPEVRNAAGRIVQHERGYLVPRDINAEVRSEFVIWGSPEDVERFIAQNTGAGKPIAHWTLSVPVRSGVVAAGSGPMSREIAKRVRDYVPDQLARDARAAMAQWAPTEPDAEELARYNRVHTPNEEKDARAEAARREKLPKSEREAIELAEREERFALIPGEREAIKRQEQAEAEFRAMLATAEKEREMRGD